jgi:hypothetical protein
MAARNEYGADNAELIGLHSTDAALFRFTQRGRI